MLKCRLDFDPHEILGIIETPPVVLVGDPPHYGRDIAASNISPQQTAAHHAYYGGRIELLKQGYIENRALARLRYRIRISGSDGRVSQPRRWRVGPANLEPNSRKGSLSELRAAVEVASCLSMFKIRFQFPTYERYHPGRPQGCVHPLLSTALSGQARRHPVPGKRLRLVHTGRCPRGHSLVGALRSRLSAVDEQAASNDSVRDRRGLDFSARPRGTGQREAVRFCSRSLR